MRAAAVDAIFIPSPGIHERLHHDAKSIALRGFELPEQVAQFCIVATATREVGQCVVNLVVQEALKLREI